MTYSSNDNGYTNASATRTATGNDGGFSQGGPANNALVYVNVSAVSGTTPTMTVKLQDSVDGTNWFDVTGGATASITATGPQLVRIASTPIAPFVRLVWTLGGTTPSFTFSTSVSLFRC